MGYYFIWLFITTLVYYRIVSLNGQDEIDEEEWNGKLEQGINYYNIKSNSEYYSRINKIISKYGRIVDGKIYNFEILVKETKCKKSSNINKINEDKCPFMDNGKQEIAAIEIYISSDGRSDDISLLGVKKYI